MSKSSTASESGTRLIPLRLRELRLLRGLTQLDLGEAAGLKGSWVSQIENGHRGMNLRTAVRLAEALGVALDDLLQEKIAPKKNSAS